MPPAVRFRNVALRSGESEILRGISLDIEPAERVALLGRSGSGKTTLLRTINAMALPTSGGVEVEGRGVYDWNPLELRRACGYVIQEGGLFPHMTVGRNIALPLEAARVAEPERERRIAELLELVALPREFAGRMPRELSGGQRQRVGVARSLATGARVLLMDEPFGALDPLTRRDMQQMMRNVFEHIRPTLVLVTHDLTEAARLADRLVLLEQGSVVADLDREEFLHSELPAVREYREAFAGAPV